MSDTVPTVDRNEMVPTVGVSVDWTGPSAVMAVGGEVDLATAPRFAAVLDTLIELGDRRVVLDLADVEFMDAKGVGVIALAARRLQSEGGQLTVRAASRSARLVLDLTGVSAIVRLEPEAAGSRLGAQGDPAEHPGVGSSPLVLVHQLARVTVVPADRDVVDAALGLVAALARATVSGVDGVSVSLARHGQVATVAATDDVAAAVDGDQYAAGEGPCIATATEGRWHHIESLDDEQRWPSFTARAQGVLMERHQLSAHDAFTVLLGQSRRTGEPLADRAAAVVDSIHGHG